MGEQECPFYELMFTPSFKWLILLYDVSYVHICCQFHFTVDNLNKTIIKVHDQNFGEKCKLFQGQSLQLIISKLLDHHNLLVHRNITVQIPSSGCLTVTSKWVSY